MSKWLAGLLIFAVVLVGLLLWPMPGKPLRRAPDTAVPPATRPLASVHPAPPVATPPPPAPAAPEESVASDVPVPAPTSAMIALARPAGPPAPVTDPSGLAPATVLEAMRTTLRQYASLFGGNPVGTNPEITKALDGDNPKQVRFLRPESGQRIDERGELVDPWGTPYFFHQISGKEMEIRSAGPDRMLWTADDLVVNSG